MPPLSARQTTPIRTGTVSPTSQEVHKYCTDPESADSDRDGTPDGDWSERREFTYSIRTVVRVMHPTNDEALVDDYQDARVAL